MPESRVKPPEAPPNGARTLPPPLQHQMESRLGQSLSHVRVHEDHRATLMSSGMGARAFTVGNDIFFPPGQYDPGSQAGQQLIAHELTHVVQQSGRPPVSDE